MDQIEIPWVLLTIICAALLVQTARLRLQDSRPRRRSRKRALHAVAGEREAEGLLEGLGHRIVARQPKAEVRVWVDGEPLTVEVRGDLLTQRRGRRYLAEVKTGQKAPRITHGPTRRQLLEYERAFDVHGLLLVDADRKTVREIAFAAPKARAITGLRFGLWLLGAAAVAAALGSLVR